VKTESEVNGEEDVANGSEEVTMTASTNCETGTLDILYIYVTLPMQTKLSVCLRSTIIIGLNIAFIH
jgi:hypothetical protein